MKRISPRAFKKIGQQAGLTLIEVLIAIALLSLMSIAIFQITTKSFDINFRLGKESTDYISVVLSLQTVEADLSQIYTPFFEPSPPAANAGVSNEIPEFWSLPARSDGIRRSRLKGTKEKISFITNGNRRVEENATQADFLKVIWEIERNSAGTYTLFRSIDWDAFAVQQERKPNRVALLENLTSASFRYYRLENKTWEDQWDTESPYAKNESRFPRLVSLKIELPDPANPNAQQTWEVTVRPNMQLNFGATSTTAATSTSTNTNTSTNPEGGQP
jgi:prepilin-type N-terminal cleavage/methylation domain-containing protein